MNWTPKEVEDAQFAGDEWYPVSDPQIRESAVRAILDKAAELLAARGGTMTVEELAACDLLSAWCEAKPRILVHMSAQGAEVAALGERAREAEKAKVLADHLYNEERGKKEKAEVERAALRAELTRHRSSVQVPVLHIAHPDGGCTCGCPGSGAA